MPLDSKILADNVLESVTIDPRILEMFRKQVANTPHPDESGVCTSSGEEDLEFTPLKVLNAFERAKKTGQIEHKIWRILSRNS